MKVTVKIESPGSSARILSALREGRTLRVVSSRLSPWTQSRSKRLFDLAVVMAVLPIAMPLCLLIAIVIRMGSSGPAFFLQKRIGRYGKSFSIVKFRTMLQSDASVMDSITTIDNQRITPVGRVLRYWKLDELPQLLNVLRGEMSLVGPRPRVPDQQRGLLKCRPGITGAASLAFAREEVLLATVPKHHLDSYYASCVLPLKQRLDDAYMARATFYTDLKLLAGTVLRVWIAAEHPEPSRVLLGDCVGEVSTGD